jgi:hypothetical protein
MVCPIVNAYEKLGCLGLGSVADRPALKRQNLSKKHFRELMRSPCPRKSAVLMVCGHESIGMG